jgi:hypothetical protein
MDKKQYCKRIIDTHSERIRSKGKDDLTVTNKKLYVVIKEMVFITRNRIFLGNKVKNEYEIRFHKKMQLILTDFCYNKINRGPDFETKFLIKRDRGEFQFVDFHWENDQEEIITWTPNGKKADKDLRGKTFRVGTYHRGRYHWDFRELSNLLEEN